MYPIIKDDYETLEGLKVGNKVAIRLMDRWIMEGPRIIEAKIIDIRKAHIMPDHRILRLSGLKDEDAYFLLYEVFVEVEGQVRQIDFKVPGPNSQEVYRRYLKKWKET